MKSSKANNKHAQKDPALLKEAATMG